MTEIVEASQQVRSPLDKVCSGSELAVETTRMAKSKGYLLELLHALDKEDDYKSFEVFSEAILAIMQSVLEVLKLGKLYGGLCGCTSQKVA